MIFLFQTTSKCYKKYIISSSDKSSIRWPLGRQVGTSKFDNIWFQNSSAISNYERKSLSNCTSITYITRTLESYVSYMTVFKNTQKPSEKLQGVSILTEEYIFTFLYSCNVCKL